MKLLSGLFLFGLLAALAVGEPSPKPGFDWSAFKSISVQTRGRLKPFDTYAREAVQFVTGSARWGGFDSNELVFNWLTAYEKGWEQTAFIRVDYKPLKREIGLDENTKYFSPEQLRNSEKLRKLAQESGQKQQRREKLTDIERKAVEVQNQWGQVEYIARGEDVTILPNPKGLHETWFPVSQLSGTGENLPYEASQKGKAMEFISSLSTQYQNGEAAAFSTNAAAFAKFLREDLGRAGYPTVSESQREIHYNALRPFRWAWICYLLAFIMLTVSLVTGQRGASVLGGVALAAAVGLHSYGFVLRCLIAGRPPVTNMYESVIWVTFGCMTFSLLIWAVYKNRVIPTAASVFAMVGLILADNLPSVLDPGIHPLEPVLRSNYWLTVHVLTITLGYAAFALSLCLGNVVIGFFLFRTEQTEKIQSLQLYMYRAVQIGVVLLAAGTILGGVWADESWGRFWGWDPKEVWALIALLLYLAVLHGRFAGWLRGFGFAAANVICFLGVLMAWYGVNFVLGAGLHSYGFGTGGLGYVGTYVLLQLGFIGAAYLKCRSQGKLNTAIFPRA